MKANIIKEDKNEIEMFIENKTVVELLRAYLAKDDDVSFVAWRQEHPTKSPILKIKTKSKTAKKALNDAISSIEKDLDNLMNDFKKAKK